MGLRGVACRSEESMLGYGAARWQVDMPKGGGECKGFAADGDDTIEWADSD